MASKPGAESHFMIIQICPVNIFEREERKRATWREMERRDKRMTCTTLPGLRGSTVYAL